MKNIDKRTVLKVLIHKFSLLDNCKNKQEANKEDMELASQISFKVMEGDILIKQ